MRNLLMLFFCFVYLAACGNEGGKIETFIEDGTGVVLNRLEPYRLKDEPASLTLREVFSIDTEDETTAAAGLTDIYLFDISDDGRIYLMRPPTGKGDLVYVFILRTSMDILHGSYGRLEAFLFNKKLDIALNWLYINNVVTM